MEDKDCPVFVSPVNSAGIELPLVSGVMKMAVATSMEMGLAGGGSGGGEGIDLLGRKKRGRPRKYDADGNMRYVAAPPLTQGFSFSSGSPPSSDVSSGKRRGRPPGSGNWQLLASLGGIFASTAGGDFTPHVVTVYTGEDVASKILSFSKKGPRGICVLSANGSVSNVTLRQPGSSGGILTYEGRFEILSLSGSFTITDNCGVRSRTGGLSVSLAGPDGRVIGGVIAGLLTAASPIQIVAGSFVPNGFKAHKRKQQYQPLPMALGTIDPTTAPHPMLQAAPHLNSCPAPTSIFTAQNHGETEASMYHKQNPDSGSPRFAIWNGSEAHSSQRPSPDINVSVLSE